MTSYAIQAGALRTNPDSGPDGVGVQADIAYTLEARAEVQAVCTTSVRQAIARGAIATPQAANDNHTGSTQGLRFLSVCSGIEAASCAWPQWQAVAFSEIEKFPSAVLAYHYPDVPNLGDFTKIDTTTLGQVDILCGGTPCQAFSVAGLRRSLDDARGNLSLAFVELAHELAGNGRTSGNGLRNVVWENVVGVLSTKDNSFGCFLAGLVGSDGPIVPPGRWTNAGMVSGPKGRAAWRVFDAQYFGVAQRRRRVIVVADFGNGADPAAVLFEPEGVRRHSPPSRETGEGVAGAAKGGAGGYSETGAGWWTEGSAGLRANPGGMPENVVAYTPEIARCVATREGSSQDYESTTMVAVGVHGDISHTLKADGADASDDGTGRGTPIVAFGWQNSESQGLSDNEHISPTLDKSKIPAICFTAKDYGGDAAYDIAPTLRAGTHSCSHANAGVMPAITVALRGREGGATAELGGEVATAPRASSGGGDKPHVLAAGLPEIAGTMKACAGKTGGFSNSADHAAAGYMVPVTTSAVRRLTPVECERLQGFPDDYTAIPWRSKPASECPDGPRYKALGNSWAVPLFAWLGHRIDAHMPPVVGNNNHGATTNKDTAIAA